MVIMGEKKCGIILTKSRQNNGTGFHQSRQPL